MVINYQQFLNRSPGIHIKSTEIVGSSAAGACAVPADAFSTPADRYEPVILTSGSRIVMVVGKCVRIVLPVERHSSRIIRIPADAFIVPAETYEMIALIYARRIVMLTAVLIIKSVNRGIRCHGRYPPDSFIVPAEAYELITLTCV